MLTAEGNTVGRCVYICVRSSLCCCLPITRVVLRDAHVRDCKSQALVLWYTPAAATGVQQPQQYIQRTVAKMRYVHTYKPQFWCALLLYCSLLRF